MYVYTKSISFYLTLKFKAHFLLLKFWALSSKSKFTALQWFSLVKYTLDTVWSTQFRLSVRCARSIENCGGGAGGGSIWIVMKLRRLPKNTLKIMKFVLRLTYISGWLFLHFALFLTATNCCCCWWWRFSIVWARSICELSHCCYGSMLLNSFLFIWNTPLIALGHWN